MSHRLAVALMIATTLMWSISGLLTRYLDHADGFEAVFWRALFAASFLFCALVWMRGPRELLRLMRAGGTVLWASSGCWAVMFTAFVLALMLTDVANVLVTIAISPLLTALFARFALGHRLPARTTLAILMAAGGIVWMYGGEIPNTSADSAAGMAIALCIPIAGAVNLTLLQYVARRAAASPSAKRPDMLVAVLLGASIAAMVSVAFALPFEASVGDVGLLAVLGTVALALPCLLLIVVSRVLSAPEISLYALMEVLFGITWVWVAVDEAPSTPVLLGGGVVIAALALNELLAMRATARPQVLEQSGAPGR